MKTAIELLIEERNRQIAEEVAALFLHLKKQTTMNKSAKDIIRENMRPLLSKEENELIEMMEQYAAQQAQEITDVGQSGQYWGDQWVKMRERAERAEKQLDEVKRLRDEAAELLHSICMMLHDGDLVANSHTNDTYIRNKISKTIKAAGFLSQLENENKDE